MPKNYTIFNENNELLDLAESRDYLSAIIPVKIERINFLLYIVCIQFLLVSSFYSAYSVNKVNTKKIVIFLVVNFIISLGILEPTGILVWLISKFQILSFMRTRAGFDLYLYFILIFIYIENNQSYKKIEKFIFLFSICIVTIFSIQNRQNISLFFKRYQEIISLVKLNTEFRNGCYFTVLGSDSYRSNFLFGYGPNIFRMVTSYKPTIHPDLDKCPYLVIGKEDIKYFLSENYVIYKNLNNYTIYKNINEN